MGSKEKKEPISVREAGRRGGTKTRDNHGHEFYVEIGRKGGSRVKRLVELGRQSEGDRS